jgi:hypothetical protein
MCHGRNERAKPPPAIRAALGGSSACGKARLLGAAISLNQLIKADTLMKCYLAQFRLGRQQDLNVLKARVSDPLIVTLVREQFWDIVGCASSCRSAAMRFKARAELMAKGGSEE